MEKLKFDYKTLEDFTADLDKYNLELPLESDVSLLKQPVQVGNKTIPNRLSVQPMEGATPADGSPGELTYRRYQRFANGGAGLIWFEATAASCRVSRLSPIPQDNVAEFKKLADATRQAGLDAIGAAPSWCSKSLTPDATVMAK